MLTYSKWNDVLATCRLRNYDPALIKKLSTTTLKNSDEAQSLSFPHVYELVHTLILEDQNPSSEYFIFEQDNQIPNKLNFLAKSLCTSIFFWLISISLAKLGMLTASNMNKLLIKLQHSEQIYRSFTNLMTHNEGLVTGSNIEMLLRHASRSEAISIILYQLIQRQGLFRSYATQKQLNALIHYSGADVDLVHLHKLFSELISSFDLNIFELTLDYASYAKHLQIIFNLIHKSKIDTTLTLKKLIRVKDSIQLIAETLQRLKLYQASLNERTVFFVKLMQHGRQFDQFHSFFTQVKDHLLPTTLETLFQLLFQYSHLLPAITRFFSAFNKWGSYGLHTSTIEFIFRYREVLFDIQFLQHLESVDTKHITAERLTLILRTCAHYEVDQTEQCLAKLLELIREYHTSPAVSNVVKIEKRSDDKRVRYCNADLKRYLKELDDNPAMNVCDINDLESEHFNCPISGAAMLTPVRVGACSMVLDLNSLLRIKSDDKGYRTHPGTRDGFLVNEIIPARDVAKSIEQELKNKKQEEDDTVCSEASDDESSSLSATL